MVTRQTIYEKQIVLKNQTLQIKTLKKNLVAKKINITKKLK